MAVKEKIDHTEQDGGGGTIFDDVFKTIVEKFPWLMVPMVNEVFGTDYGESELVEEEKTEYQIPDSRRTMDSHIKIRDKVYHMECQSNWDSFMAIRMVEYDFYESLDRTRRKLWDSLREGNGERIELEFPNSCVLYLRNSGNAPEQLEIDIKIPGNAPSRYMVPVVRTQKYTIEEIFQKKLLMLLPFYILRYEKWIRSGADDFLDAWEAEYTNILQQIRMIREYDRRGVYEQLVELTRKLADYVGGKNQRFMERMESVMGGQVLELQTGKAWEEGLEQGKDQMNRLIQYLSENGRTEDLLRSTKDKAFQEKLLEECGL